MSIRVSDNVKKRSKREHSTIGFCPVCSDDKELESITRRENFSVRGESIEIEACFKRCKSCGETFSHFDDDEANYKKIYDLYRGKHALLKPEEIRKIREQFGISQRQFSRIMGWGAITMHRYEAGSLQDNTHNSALLLLQSCPDLFYVLLKGHEEELKINNKTKEKIENRVDELFIESVKNRLEAYLSRGARIMKGNKDFDWNKFQNSVLYFLENVDDVFRTKLNKLLFYFDFLHFKHFDSSVTGSTYIHLPLGPVPDQYDFLVAEMNNYKLIDTEEVVYQSNAGQDFTAEKLIALKKCDQLIFSDSERLCLKKIIEFFGDFSSQKIKDFSHEEAGYSNTAPKEPIPYSWAKKLRISL